MRQQRLYQRVLSCGSNFDTSPLRERLKIHQTHGPQTLDWSYRLSSTGLMRRSPLNRFHLLIPQPLHSLSELGLGAKLAA